LIREEVEFAPLHVPDPPYSSYERCSQGWAEAKFRNYVRAVGEFSVYLNSTLRSPMPRSRGEAMMLGLATVNMRNHDVDLFIRNGTNGFFADSPDEMAEQIRFLYRNPAALTKMSAASRRTALDLFNQDRYLAEWSRVFADLLG
jgi:glycosyltransferase involved in cell wall biosynthesis